MFDYFLDCWVEIVVTALLVFVFVVLMPGCIYLDCRSKAKMIRELHGHDVAWYDTFGITVSINETGVRLEQTK